MKRQKLTIFAREIAKSRLRTVSCNACLHLSLPRVRISDSVSHVFYRYKLHCFNGKNVAKKSLLPFLLCTNGISIRKILVNWLKTKFPSPANRTTTGFRHLACVTYATRNSCSRLISNGLIRTHTLATNCYKRKTQNAWLVLRHTESRKSPIAPPIFNQMQKCDTTITVCCICISSSVDRIFQPLAMTSKIGHCS